MPPDKPVAPRRMLSLHAVSARRAPRARQITPSLNSCRHAASSAASHAWRVPFADACSSARSCLSRLIFSASWLLSILPDSATTGSQIRSM